MKLAVGMCLIVMFAVTLGFTMVKVGIDPSDETVSYFLITLPIIAVFNGLVLLLCWWKK